MRRRIKEKQEKKKKKKEKENKEKEKENLLPAGASVCRRTVLSGRPFDMPQETSASFNAQLAQFAITSVLCHG